MESRFGDIRDLDQVSTFVEEVRPEIVIHMAAQALVRESYESPVETYATNVMGSVHVLEAAVVLSREDQLDTRDLRLPTSSPTARPPPDQPDAFAGFR